MRTPLAKPPFDYPLEEGKSCVRMENGHFHAMMDRLAAVQFLFDLHWLCTSLPFGDDISIGQRGCDEWGGKGTETYCEIHLIPPHNPNRKHNAPRREPHGKHSPEAGRVDYFVTPDEVRTAYETLLELMQREKQDKPLEAMLWATLKVTVREKD